MTPGEEWKWGVSSNFNGQERKAINVDVSIDKKPYEFAI